MSPALPTYFIALTDSWCWCDASVFHAVPILGLVLCRAVLSTYTSCFLAEHKQLASLSSLLLLAGSASSSSLFLKRNDANDPSPQNDASRPAGMQHLTRRKLPSFPNVDFSGFQGGDIVTNLGNGVSVATIKRNADSSTQTGTAMIFDTANPTGGDDDLGTPHKSFGGPGVGKGGKKNKLFENRDPQGFALIISEDHADAVTNPDDNEYGGELEFTFDPPRYLDSVGLLDNDSTNGTTFTIVTADGGTDVRVNKNGGNNSFERVKIGKPMVVSLTVDFADSGAISFLDFSFPPTSCPGLNALLPLESYAFGDTISDFGNGVTVQASKSNSSGQWEMASAMVFDSSNPSGGDFDLGTPHVTFGGPGIGKQGKKTKLFENRDAQGNVLIVSEDNDASDPDDNGWASTLVFTFSPPRFIESIGLLDNDEGTSFTIETSDGGSSTIMDMNGGNNSFESVKIGKPGVTKLTVDLGGSGAVTDILACN